MTAYFVGIGQTSSGIALNSSDTLVDAGGTVSATTINNGGAAVIEGGISFTILEGAGVAFAREVPGTAIGTVVNSGGTLTVEGIDRADQGIASNTVINRGGLEVVTGGQVGFGGLDVSGTVNSGGRLTVSVGGTASRATIGSGGVELVYAGGIASATIIQSGGTLIALSGAITSDTLAATGANVVSTGVIVLSLDGVLAGPSPTVTGGMIGSGNLALVLSGGTASGLTVNNGGDQEVYGGGNAIGTILNSGGVQGINSGGIARAAIVGPGAIQALHSGGGTIGTLLSGTQSVDLGGGALNTMVFAGGVQDVAGFASGTVVSSGGTVVVFAGGTASGATIASSGFEFVSSGANALATNIAAGGVLVALPGANVAGTMAAPGASIIAAGVIVLSNSTIVAGPSQTLTGIALGSGTTEWVLPLGTAINTTVGSASDQLVYGVVSNTSVGSNAGQVVESGGTAIGTTDVGGSQSVYGGTAIGTSLSGNFVNEYVSSGATIGTVIGSGAAEYVLPGQVAINTTVLSGGTLYVQGLAIGVTVAAGGTVSQQTFNDVVSAGVVLATSAAAVIFGPAPTLTNVQVGSGEVLYVVPGGAAVNATVGSFGTEFVYSGGTDSGGAVLSGGVEQVQWGGTATGTTVNGGKLIVSNGGTESGAVVVSGGSVEFGGPVGVGTTVSFTGPGVLLIDDLLGPINGPQQQTFNAPIAGLGASDQIALATFGLGNFTGVDTATPGPFNVGTDTTPLVLKSGGATVAVLTLVGDYTGRSFTVSQAAGGFVTVALGMLSPPAVTEALVSDTGISPTDKITSDPAVTGGGDPNATVTISEGGATLGTAMANNAGTWTFLPSLTDGVHTLVASETNAAGTGSASLTFTLDTTPPVLALDSPLGIAAGTTAPLTANLLRFDDNLATHAQETYSVVAPPADGTLLKSGAPIATFTQVDLDNGLVSYHETNLTASSDMFSFTVSDAAGNMTPVQQFNVAIAPPVNLYDFFFLYNDYQAKGTSAGDYYYGTVADDGSFGYSVGESIAAPLGTYIIYANAGLTVQPVGTVNDYFYWDGAGSHLAFAPFYSTLQGHSPVENGGGLGSDFDYLLDDSGRFHFFDAAAEAVVHTSTVFGFYFTFNDFAANGANGGDYYYGTVADDGRFGYSVGATIATALGSYHIYGTGGVTAQMAGTVDDYFYWDGASSHQGYVPYYAAQQGHSPIDSPGGLGNDFDYILAGNGQFHPFGGDLVEAKA